MKTTEQLFTGLHVALVHDWLTGMRGGEKVLEIFCRLFPKAPIYTLLHIPGSVSPQIESHPIHTSFVQSLPHANRYYRHYLPLFPYAAEHLKIEPCDLVISSSHCVAKGIYPPIKSLHISYLHTPMRYIWDLYKIYFGPGRDKVSRVIMPLIRRHLQYWDIISSYRVNHFLANSIHVAQRIKKFYNRQATVIYPPVDTNRFNPAQKQELDDYYLVVGALVPYKRVELAILACHRSGRKLKIVGTGPEFQRLKILSGPKIEFLGWQPDEKLPSLYANAQALIFPGKEDFGITPLESMAAGRPVVAYSQGGALETVIGLDDPLGRQPTGVFFYQQNEQSLIAALDYLEHSRHKFDPQYLACHARSFNTNIFIKRFTNFLLKFLTDSPLFLSSKNIFLS